MKHAWKWLSQRSETPGLFGNVFIVVLVLTQCLDGVFTYVGVTNWGFDMESNHLVIFFMSVMGIGLGLAIIKLVGIGLGIFVYQRGLHNTVAFLAIVYLVFGVLPWTVGLFLLLYY